MAIICKKKECVGCNHFRFDEEKNEMCCFKRADLKNLIGKIIYIERSPQETIKYRYLTVEDIDLEGKLRCAETDIAIDDDEDIYTVIGPKKQI